MQLFLTQLFAPGNADVVRLLAVKVNSSLVLQDGAQVQRCIPGRKRRK